MTLFSREALGGIGALGLTGFVSAVSLLVLASNRIPGIPADVVAALLLAIQYHLIGLTLAKFGVDQAVFAIVSKDPGAALRIKDTLALPILPCIAFFGLVYLLLFSSVGALCLTGAVLLDTLATIHTAELNARRKFAESAIGNLLNYPVFVVLWATVAGFTTPTLDQGLALFFATRALRYVWVSSRTKHARQGTRPARLAMKGLVGIQGALNLVTFRSDQLLIALLLFTGVAWIQEGPSLGWYVFLARFPEIATGFLILIGTVIFPTRHLTNSPLSTSADVLRYYSLIALAVGACSGIALAVSEPLFGGAPPPLGWWGPYIAQIVLVLLANLLAFSMQSQGFLRALLRNYVVSIFCGAPLAAIGMVNGSILYMAWTIPLQLAAFIALGLLSPWGEAHATFRLADNNEKR